MSLKLPNEVPSIPLCRQMLRTMLRSLRVDAARAFDIEVVLSEAVTNVIRHAHLCAGCSYSVTIELAPDWVRLQVADEGRGFMPLAGGEPDAEQIAGRGLWLITQLADTVTVRSKPGAGCLLQAEFALAQPLALAVRPPARYFGAKE